MLHKSERLARLRLELSKFDFNFVHRSGVAHRAAEALPRLHSKGKETTDLDDDVPLWNVKNRQMAKEEIPHGDACTEWYVEKKPTTINFARGLTKDGAESVRTVEAKKASQWAAK